MTKVRKCSTCQERLPLKEFSPSPVKLDGVTNVCLSCSRVKNAKYRTTSKYKANMREYSRLRYRKNKHKYKARAAARQAAKDGVIAKPTECSSCLEELPLEAHHDDYDKPLDVTWFCNLCHKIKHGRVRDERLLASKPAFKEATHDTEA